MLSRRRPYKYSEQYLPAPIRFFKAKNKPLPPPQVTIYDLPVEIWFLVFHYLQRNELPMYLCKFLQRISQDYVASQINPYLSNYVKNNYNLKLEPDLNKTISVTCHLIDIAKDMHIDRNNKVKNYIKLHLLLSMFLEICQFTIAHSMLELSLPTEMMSKDQLILITKTLTTINHLTAEKIEHIENDLSTLLNHLQESFQEKFNIKFILPMICFFPYDTEPSRIKELLLLCLNQINGYFELLQTSFRPQSVNRI